ncbi:MAG: PAN domain-containing protein [Proteobacteria bacterium]|nr:PAN domain-containing protein [Pseudomonadota bacterium]
MKRLAVISVVVGLLSWPAFSLAQYYSCGYFNKCPAYQPRCGTFWDAYNKKGASIQICGERGILLDWTNRISSAKVPPNADCLVCTGNYFYGKCLVLNSSSATNLPWAFKNAIKSVSCQQFRYFTTRRPGPNCGETWNLPWFGGWRNHFVAPFTSAYLPKHLRKAISSIRLGRWVKCTVWDQKNFKGQRLDIPPGAGLPNLQAHGFDNRIVSIKCVEIPGKPLSFPGHVVPPAPSPPPPRTAVKPPGGGPATAYHPPTMVPFPADVTSEPNLNRPGLDYRKLVMPARSPDACRRACLADPRCRAFTYVRPSDRDRRAWCRLKHGVPRPIRSRCCVSGVKTTPAGPAPGPGATPQPGPGPTPGPGVSGRCPPGQVWNARSGRCLAMVGPQPGYRPGVRCPPGQLWNGRMRRCVCLPGHWWNARLGRCVARAVTGRPPMVRRCPPGQHWDVRRRRCVCPPGHWWNARQRRCVARAAQPGRPPMVHRCPPGQHWNARLRRCVCPPGLWWNARLRRCMRRAAPPRPPAVHRCPPGQQWSPQAKRCLPVVR